MAPGAITTPFDTNNNANAISPSFNANMSTTQYQYAQSSPEIDFYEYVAFWNVK